MLAARTLCSVWLLVGTLGLGCGGKVGGGAQHDPPDGNGNGGVTSDTQQTLQGYLVFDCTWQAYPLLKDQKSADGRSCYLDAFLSATPPGAGVPDVCDEEPVTSWCLLENAGVRTSERVAEVTLHGDLKMLSVCRSGGECTGKSLDCEWPCQPERVFVPEATNEP
jgi:hypothetical protein